MLALGLSLLSAAGLLWPIAEKGPLGVTVRYLSDYSYVSFTNAVPMAIFGIAPLVMMFSLLALTGRLRAVVPWYFVLGGAGVLISVLGVFEGIGHIVAFSNGCAVLAGSNLIDAPIRIGVGGIMQVIAYGSLLTVAFVQQW